MVSLVGLVVVWLTDSLFQFCVVSLVGLVGCLVDWLLVSVQCGLGDCLTPSLLQHVKFPGGKMQGLSCK